MAFDSLGRDIGTVKPQDLLGPVGERKPFSPTSEQQEESAELRFFDRLLKAFADLKDVIAGAIDRARGAASEVIDQHVAVGEMRQQRQDGPQRHVSLRDLGSLTGREMGKLIEDQSEDFADNFKLLNLLARAGLHKGSMFTHDTHSERELRVFNKINAKLFQQNHGILNALKAIGEKLGADMKTTEKAVAAGVTDAVKSGSTVPADALQATLDMDNLGSEAATVVLGEIESQQEERKKGRLGHDQDYYDRRRTYGSDDLMVRLIDEFVAFRLNWMRYVGNRTARAAGSLMEQEGRPNPMNMGLFGGMNGIFADLGQANNYQKAIAEVAYATQGITAETQKQQAMYRANAEMADIAVSSGWDKVSVEKTYLKLLKQGYRGQKDIVKVTSTSANLATMIGSNFEATADFANDLHMALGLSSDAVGDIARGMQQTARSSKISGDALLQAAQGAKPFLEAMKRAGTLTSNVAKNMIDLQASAQKFGVAESFQDLFQGMTGPNAVMGASSETQALMAIMGGHQGLMPFMDGRMASDKGLQRRGVQNLSHEVGMITGGMDLSKLAAMGEEDLAAYINDNWQLNLQVKGHTGKELGELVKGFKVFQEATMSFEDRMGDINKKLAKATLTEEERTQLLKQQADLLQGKRADVGARAALSLEGAKSLEEGYARMRRNKTTMQTFGESARTGVFGSGFDEHSLQTDEGMQQALMTSMMDSFRKTNEVLAKSADMGDDKFIVKGFESQIKTAFARRDVDQIVKLQKQMSEAQEAATAAEMADTDPARAAAKGINSLNALFKEKMDDALMYLKLIAGANLIQGTGIASFITSGLSVLPWKEMQGVLLRLDKGLGNGKLGNVVKGVASGVKEGLGLDRAGGAVVNAARSGRDKAMDVLYGSARHNPFPSGMIPEAQRDTGLVGKLGRRLEPVGDFVREWFGRGKDLVLGPKVAPSGPFPAGMYPSSAMQRNGVVSKVGRAAAEKAGQMGRGVRAFAERAIASPRVGINEGILRFAKFQDKIPVWGKFASKFGGGADAMKAAAKYSAFGKHISGGSTAAAARVIGVEGISKVAAKAALPLLVFQTAMEGVGQAMKTGARAAEIFGDAEGKVGVAHRHAAENAGMLTGMLNSLTFGIFDHWIGATGSVTDGLAKLIDGFPLLNAVLSALMIPVKAIYGVFWGLIAVVEEVGKGIWDGLVAAFEPINEAAKALMEGLSELWVILSDVLSPLNEVFGEFEGGVSWVDAIIGGFRLLGKVLGWVFRAVGMLVGTLLKILVPAVKVVVWAITSLVRTIGGFLKPVVEGIARVIGGVVTALGGLLKVLKGIVTLDFSMIGSGLKSIFFGLLDAVGGAVEGVADFIYGVFGAIIAAPANLIGEAIGWIGDLGKDAKGIGGFINKYLLWPFRLIGNLFKGIGGVLTGFANIIAALTKLDFSGVLSIIKSGFQSVANQLPKFLLDGIKSLPSKVWDLFRRVVGSITQGLLGIPQAIIGSVASLGQEIAGIFASTFQTIVEKVMNLMRMIPGMDWIIGKQPAQPQPVDNRVGAPAGAVAPGPLENRLPQGPAALPRPQPVVAPPAQPQFSPTPSRAQMLMEEARRRQMGQPKVPVNQQVPAPPAMAVGGVVETPGLIYAGEAGPELVVPVDQFQRMIASVAYGPETALKMIEQVVAKEVLPTLSYGQPQQVPDAPGRTADIAGPLLGIGAAISGVTLLNKVGESFGGFVAQAVGSKNIDRATEAAGSLINRVADPETYTRAAEAAQGLVSKVANSQTYIQASAAAGSLVSTIANSNTFARVNEVAKSIQQTGENLLAPIKDGARMVGNFVGGTLDSVANVGTDVANFFSGFDFGATPAIAESVIKTVNPLTTIGDTNGLLGNGANAGVASGVNSISAATSGGTKDIEIRKTYGERAAERAVYLDTIHEGANDETFVRHLKDALVPLVTLGDRIVSAIVTGLENSNLFKSEGLAPLPQKPEDTKINLTKMTQVANSTSTGMFKQVTNLFNPMNAINTVSNAMQSFGEWLGILPKSPEPAATDKSLSCCCCTCPPDAGAGKPMSLPRPEIAGTLDKPMSRAMADDMIFGPHVKQPDFVKLVNVPSVETASWTLPSTPTAVDKYTDTATAVIGDTMTTSNVISARPLSDIQTRVEQDYATSQPVAATVSSTELAKVATLTERQVMLMTMQLDELREIKTLLQPGNLSGSVETPSGTTRTQSKPRSSTNFFGLSFGGYGGNASKGYINDGVT